MKRKVKNYLAMLFLMTSTAVFANTYQVMLTFVNCTNQAVELNNESNPYKFSLIPSKPANNGYSEVYHLTIPPLSVFNYSNMSVYFNSYIDGGMDLHFSGGIKGYAAIHQAQDLRFKNCYAQGYCVYSIDMLTTSSDSLDVVFLTPTQILDGQLANTNHLVVSLGCNRTTSGE